MLQVYGTPVFIQNVKREVLADRHYRIRPGRTSICGLRHCNRGEKSKGMCVQRRLAYSVGVQSHLGKSQSPVAWIAGRKETEFLKPIDKAISRMVSKSPGRNVSEPIGGLEN